MREKESLCIASIKVISLLNSNLNCIIRKFVASKIKLVVGSESVDLLHLQTFQNRLNKVVFHSIFFKYEQKPVQRKDDLFIFVLKKLTDLFLDMVHMVK